MAWSDAPDLFLDWSWVKKIINDCSVAAILLCPSEDIIPITFDDKYQMTKLAPFSRN